MDAGPYNYALMAGSMYAYGDFGGFPGYPYLMMLALRAEYRNMASGLATELTREWITLNSSRDGRRKNKKESHRDYSRNGATWTAANHSLGGRTGCILWQRANPDRSERSRRQSCRWFSIRARSRKNSLENFRVVEPIWTTPLMYNALDPSRPDFYKPSLLVGHGPALARDAGC